MAHQRRRRWPSAEERVLRADLQRHPGPLALAELGGPGHHTEAIGRLPASRPRRKGAAVTTATAPAPTRSRHQRPLPCREPARPEAGGTRDHPDADRHRVPDDPGDLAVGLQLLAHRAGRPHLRRAGELPDRPDRLAVLADHRHHGVLHGVHRRDRAGHRVRLRHGDAPADLRARRRAHLDPRALRHHHGRLRLRLAVRLLVPERIRQRLAAVRQRRLQLVRRDDSPR